MDGENMIYVIGTLAYFAIAGLVARLLHRFEHDTPELHGIVSCLWPVVIALAVIATPCVLVYGLAAGKDAWE